MFRTSFGDFFLKVVEAYADNGASFEEQLVRVSASLDTVFVVPW
jgi:hypothetical protein